MANGFLDGDGELNPVRTGVEIHTGRVTGSGGHVIDPVESATRGV